MSYSALLLHHFHHPQYVGQISPGPGVYESQTSIVSGERVRLAIAVENGLIQDARYQVYGCPVMIACMSWLASKLIKQSFVDVKCITASTLNTALDLPAHKYRCAVLAAEALEKVCEQWYNDT